MGKYVVKHACGHEVEYQFYGKIDDREEKAAYLETEDCPQCQNKKQLATIDESRFAILEGSEKQTVWARAIRAKAMRNPTALNFLNKIALLSAAQMEQLKEEYISGKVAEYGNPYMLRAVAAILENSAKWWIDHR